MNIIFIHPRRGTRTVRIPVWFPWAAGILLVALPVVLGMASYWLLNHWNTPSYGTQVLSRWQEENRADRSALAEVRQQSADTLHALTLKFADMQAKLVRLDALGERLVNVANIKSDEFDFSVEPGIGGPDLDDGKGIDFQPPVFMNEVDRLAVTLDRRQQQLDILAGLLQEKHLKKNTELAGSPIAHGWLSSRFGYRSDPFTGELHMHKGMDFAGKQGASVLATAAGVVTWSGPRQGYGMLVEINHGNGVSTRYAHCEALLVQPGDIVKAGQTIALMGSTGRSTGPHVHYEVLKNGVAVNPMTYTLQARR